MAIYYIDVKNGKNDNDAMSEQSPVKDYKAIDIKAGDTVLFKRGSFIRGKLYNVEGEEGAPVTYGAYGEGEKPVFCGSIKLNDADMWQEVAENVWQCSGAGSEEVANLVFNGNNEAYGTLRWSFGELKEQGDFFDECFGYSASEKRIPDTHKFYLYSEKNPALFYSDIECVVTGAKNLADNGCNMIFKDLKFINSGVHAIAGDGETRNMKVINCDFINIGGAVWNSEIKVRFGNGIEMWNVGDNVEVKGCYFENIYDSAVTQQGGRECTQADNFIIRDNVFVKCGMASYEQRDRLPLYAEFCDNICVDAGMGFSRLGEVMPRRSEIWPQPMGHHIFLWRIGKEEKGRLVIKNNVFYNAPFGAAIYSIIDKTAEDLTELENNTYYTENSELLNRWHGKNFASFEEYSMIERCSYEKRNIKELINSKLNK